MTVSSVKNVKKRDINDLIASSQFKGEETTVDIDSILQNLKERVLMNETLNNFKKEISLIADAIEKRDPQWNQSFSNSVSLKLSSILQKQSP
jgi:hypothetical protein